MKKFYGLGPRIPLPPGALRRLRGSSRRVFFSTNSITINNTPILIIFIALESVKEGL